MHNPLLKPTHLPPFSSIEVAHIEPAIDAVLAQNRAEVAALTAEQQAHDWQSLMGRLEESSDRLSYAWSRLLT